MGGTCRRRPQRGLRRECGGGDRCRAPDFQAPDLADGKGWVAPDRHSKADNRECTDCSGWMKMAPESNRVQKAAWWRLVHYLGDLWLRFEDGWHWDGETAAHEERFGQHRGHGVLSRNTKNSFILMAGMVVHVLFAFSCRLSSASPFQGGTRSGNGRRMGGT